MVLPEMISAPGAILLVCDHASNVVPRDISLGVHQDVMRRHVAIDIGAASLTRVLSVRLAAPAILATVSRLVIDLHRPTDHPGLIPLTSDGHAVPGNITADRAGRIARFHAPYHRAIERHIRIQRPELIVAIHSFTPQLEQDGAPRPWEVGILHNRQSVAARDAIARFREAGIVTGDNQPYSGRALNMTLNRHGEGQGIAAFSIEVRNDLISIAAGVDAWAAIIAPVITQVRNGLAQNAALAT